MTYLILSDSHGRVGSVEEAIRRVQPDGILFAGDGIRDFSHLELPCPLYAVAGNCDSTLAPVVIDGETWKPQEEALITLNADDRATVRVLLMHGHRHGVKSTITPAIVRAMELGVDILVFGHTHAPVELTLGPDRGYSSITPEKPLLVINPGSVADYFNPTFATLTLRRGQALAGLGCL